LRRGRGIAREASAVTGHDRPDVFRTQAPESARPNWNTPAKPLDAAAILESVGDVVYEWRLDTDALSWGTNLSAVLGTEPGQLKNGRLYARLLHPDNTATRFDAVMRSGQRDDGKGVPYRVEYALRTTDGGKVWVEDTGRWFAGAEGKPLVAHGVIRVVNERHAREEKLAYLSRFDGLTGEMNRSHLTELLEQALEEATRYRSSCGFLIVAIDNLARINEAYGFEVADEVIGAVGKRIRAKMRVKDFLGRFSGNKFGIILKDCSPDEMTTAAERFLAGVRDDVVQTSCGPVAVTVSIGGVAAPRHARTVHEILARAQESLSSAKARRLGSFLAYRPSVEREALRRENVRSTDEIVAALNERRIVIAFEPVVRTLNRQPAFYECLMRIHSADGVLVPAQSVIPVAERLGLVRLLDQRVLELVVAELAGDPSFVASVNVSPASTTDPDWWAGLGAQLRGHPGVAERLILEITETTAIQDMDDARCFVARVKELGCRIAIDDFGAGHTSFRNLRKLAVDIVKIDGAFIQNLPRSPEDRAFTRTLIELARALGLSTVAEWVQDEEAAALLAEWGCDYLQGALVGHPLTERLRGEAAPTAYAASA
jgi:diguanylate cyclase (GGDEF)-like protein/PAS domain S-box-containing protein